MDTISGFNLLADSSDSNLFAQSGHYYPPPTTPPSLQQSHASEILQMPLNNFYDHNMAHPLLADDVQVSYNLQHVQAPPAAPAASTPAPQSSHMIISNPEKLVPSQIQLVDIKMENAQPMQQSPALLPPRSTKRKNTLGKGQAMHSESSESDMPEDEIEDENNEEEPEVRITEMHTPLDAVIKNVLVCLIGEYLSEVITLRLFLTKVRQCLCGGDSNSSNKEVFTWILRCLLEGGATGSGHVQRMAKFLEENGVTKPEIETSSVALKDENGGYGMMEFDIGEKRKRREKKSISRGLRSAPNKWCKAESQLLIRLVHENGDKSWKKIAEQLGGGKTGAQCAQHWKRVLSPQIRKGSWDDQEEELLLALVERYGQSWKNIAGEIKTRTDIQCRYQYQKSCLSRQCEWQPQEDTLLAKKVAQVLHESSGSNNPSRMPTGNVINWVEVAKFIARAKLTKIPRTALEAKQRWYALNGNILPQTHTMQPHINNNSNSNNNNPITTIAPPTSTHAHPPTITPNTFHNINYSNINSNFTMVAQPY